MEQHLFIFKLIWFKNLFLMLFLQTIINLLVLLKYNKVVHLKLQNLNIQKSYDKVINNWLLNLLILVSIIIVISLCLRLFLFDLLMTIQAEQTTQYVKLGPEVHWDDSILSISVFGPNLCCCRLYNVFFILAHMYAFVPDAFAREDPALLTILEKYAPILIRAPKGSNGYPSLEMTKQDYTIFRCLVQESRFLTESRFALEYGGFFYEDRLDSPTKIMASSLDYAKLILETTKR